MTKSQTSKTKKTKTLESVEEKLEQLNSQVIENAEKTLNTEIPLSEYVLNEVKNAFDEIQTDFSDGTDNFNPEIDEEKLMQNATEPIKEFVDECDRMKNSEADFFGKIANSKPEEIENIVTNEINRVEELKSRLMEKVRSFPTSNVTHSWNGITQI